MSIELNSLSRNITNLVTESKLSTVQIIVIQHLLDLLDIKNDACTLHIFSKEDIDTLIREVATRCEHILLNMYGIHRYVNYINVLIHIIMFFIRDLCLIRDYHTVFNNCAITKEELSFLINHLCTS